jgi:hypothetical protein
MLDGLTPGAKKAFFDMCRSFRVNLSAGEVAVWESHLSGFDPAAVEITCRQVMEKERFFPSWAAFITHMPKTSRQSAPPNIAWWHVDGTCSENFFDGRRDNARDREIAQYVLEHPHDHGQLTDQQRAFVARLAPEMLASIGEGAR